MSQTKEQEQDQVYAGLCEMAKASGMSEEEFDTIYKSIQGGATIAEVLNISKDMLESAYAYGYQLYQAANYTDAEAVFRWLTMYSSGDYRFWMGFAGCIQARGDYKNAIDAYSMAGLCENLCNPTPFYYGGLCYMKLGDSENAIGAFKGALALGDESNPEHKLCHERIKALLASLEGTKE